ncbi:hypothetical protein CAPTEDRAFT_193019 [Capitella teleta]|uniref:VWFA domain-containing protein n=1 Tax=Capitella teleta TaxID=283909 RepID=R7VI99_CAPTE|nr:hypothetical protein CAPTEDRAFT_193019 [Capitella teleta]|eukprot:ELU16026.1 hypothetical protein CAPTEDRAFT_193019 [Capitella teleta]
MYPRIMLSLLGRLRTDLTIIRRQSGTTLCLFEGASMMVNDFLLVGLVIFLFSQTTLASNADSYELTERLRSYVNHRLGVEKMQTHLDSLSFSRTPVIPEELLATVNRNDGGFFKVNRRDACLHGQGLNKNPTKFLNDQIIQVMKENLHLYPSIKFQYVGTEEGVTTVYPRFKSCSSTYDPRFRPWYVEAATPESKDVVVVIDTSGSMSDSYSSRVLMDIAKEAANTVITTLNPNDRVGIVSFSDVARTATGGNNLLKCKRTELALATPQNKEYLKSYVNNLRPDGTTVYSRAFSLAFDYFNDSDSIDKVILFLTDGLPTDGEENILNGIADRNAKLKNSVVILTYGLAAGYKRAITQKGRISLSIPYEDAFGAGAVITMSKTLLAGRADNSHDDSDPIVGVMGLDFTMNVFYYFMTDAFPECADPDNLGCFMVDDGGFVVMHHDWLDLDDKHAAYNVHIAAKEPGVAKILIEENLMHRLGCINHEDRLNQFTWLDGPLPACVAWTQVQCTCADEFEFNFCQNKPELDTRDSYAPCAAFEDNSLTPLPPSRMSEDLKQCHYYDCESKSKRDCQTTATCTWLGESCSVSKSKEGPFSVLIIVAIAVGVVAVVLIITWICCCHLKKKRRER